MSVCLFLFLSSFFEEVEEVEEVDEVEYDDEYEMDEEIEEDEEDAVKYAIKY